jgi:hypothetical protein
LTCGTGGKGCVGGGCGAEGGGRGASEEDAVLDPRRVNEYIILRPWDGGRPAAPMAMDMLGPGGGVVLGKCMDLTRMARRRRSRKNRTALAITNVASPVLRPATIGMVGVDEPFEDVSASVGIGPFDKSVPPDGFVVDGAVPGNGLAVDAGGGFVDAAGGGKPTSPAGPPVISNESMRSK